MRQIHNQTTLPIRLTSIRALFMRLTLIPLVLILLMGTVAVAYAQTPTADSESEAQYDEAEAYNIDSMIMCPVCPAETIDQAQVPLARQMKQIVREKLAEGESREAILEYFVERYGQNILAAPPKRGFNLVAWLLPVVVLIGSLVLAIFALRSMKQKDVLRDMSDDSELEPYLEMVDDIILNSTTEPATQDKARVNPIQSGDNPNHG